MEIDLTQNDLFTLLGLVERELERGAAARDAGDVDGCLNAAPPLTLKSLQNALQAAVRD